MTPDINCSIPGTTCGRLAKPVASEANIERANKMPARGTRNAMRVLLEKFFRRPIKLSALRDYKGFKGNSGPQLDYFFEKNSSRQSCFIEKILFYLEKITCRNSEQIVL